MKMEEARHAWASLKSIRKLSSSLSNGNNEGNGSSTTTWYDVPVPVIVHCHEFPDASETRDVSVVVEQEAKEKERQEEACQTEEQVASEEKFETPMERKDSGEKRHTNTVELTAVSSVITDEDGLPEISFSFHRTNAEKNRSSVGEVEETVTSIGKATVTVTATATDTLDNRQDESTQNRLYDFPKSLHVADEIETEKVVESRREAEAHRQQIPATNEESRDHDSNDHSDDTLVDEKCVTSKINSTDGKDRYDRAKRLVRSLKYGRKRYGESDSDGYDAGIASMSGSYSDPECSNDTLSNNSPRWKNRRQKVESMDAVVCQWIRLDDNNVCLTLSIFVENFSKNIDWFIVASDPSIGKRGTIRIREQRASMGILKLQKHRFGKAWDKMRSWLRDETTRINEVVNKHARLQAVGALTGEARVPSKNSSASYDLTKASTQELGSITKVEEFGLASVSEENVIRSSEDSEISLIKTRKNSKNDSNNLRQVVGSSNDVFQEEGKEKIVPISSYSMDKLCSDTEHEEHAIVEIENNRDHARKAGLIKRRMLGSIRGLMASTHLLHVHEPEEVLTLFRFVTLVALV